MSVSHISSPIMRTIIFVAIIGAAFAVPRQQRIVGGTPTTVNQYPYMSNMQSVDWGVFWSQYCGGSLITSRTVLSAAHCYFLRDSPSLWRVRLGTSFASSGGSVHEVQQIISHENYDHPTLVNDIAIIRLSTPAIFSNTVAAARIPGRNYNLPDGSIVTAIGWGDLWYEGVAPEQLQHVNVTIINQQICAERYAYLKTQPRYENWPDITEGMVCAGILNVGGADACQGDSGGPLVVDRNIIYGVSSWGFECAHYFYPGVNARVSHYSDWIVANGSA